MNALNSSCRRTRMFHELKSRAWPWLVLLAISTVAVTGLAGRTATAAGLDTAVSAATPGEYAVRGFADVLSAALSNNPEIGMAEARTEQAAELSVQNGSFRFPTAELSGAYGPEFNDPAPGFENGRGVSEGGNLKLIVSQLLFDGGSSRSEYSRSKRLHSAAQAETLIVIEEIFRDVMTAYIDYWRFQVELSEAEVFVTTMQSLLDKLDTMYRSGAASKLEVDFARARLAAARGQSSSATASLNNAFSELEYLVPGLTPFQASSPEEYSNLELLSLSEYLEHGASANSGFVTNELSADATRLRVAAQRGRFMPSLELELSASVIDDEGGPSTQRDKRAAKLVLSYTLYSGGERRAGVRRAEAQLREIEAERAKLERDVFRAIDQSYNSITAARLTLDATLDEIAANQELQRLNRQNLKLGTINIIELIDVEERLYNSAARRHEIVATMYQEYFDLLISSGYSRDLLQRYSTLETGSAG